MSATLTAAELTAMRAVEEEALPGTAVIYRSTEASDGMGGFTETWTAVGTVAARLTEESRMQREFVTGGQIVSYSLWNVVMPQSTTVTAEDRIRYTPGSRVFEINFVQNDRAWPTALRAEVMAVNEEQARQTTGAATYLLDFSDATQSMYLGAV